MKSCFLIRSMAANDLIAIKNFTDRSIGSGYYSLSELEEIFQKSQHQNKVCSLVLCDSAGQIFGVRITYPPGKWDKGKGQGLSPQLWKSSIENTAYFQSLFVDPSLTRLGWGKKMSIESIKLLRELKTQAIVTHSWKESPHDSSGRYLRAIGFEKIATHPLYWHEVDYTCTRCGKPCLCTAEEMILYL